MAGHHLSPLKYRKEFLTMPNIHQPVTYQMRRTATSTNTFTISSLPTEPNMCQAIDCISVANLSSATKVVDIGVKRNEKEIILETIILTIAGYYYKTHGVMHVPSDWRLIVKCRTPTDGDKYVVNVFGYLKPFLKE